MGKIDK